jgi:hypothetical protein
MSHMDDPYAESRNSAHPVASHDRGPIANMFALVAVSGADLCGVVRGAIWRNRRVFCLLAKALRATSITPESRLQPGLPPRSVTAGSPAGPGDAGGVGGMIDTDGWPFEGERPASWDRTDEIGRVAMLLARQRALATPVVPDVLGRPRRGRA